MIEGAGMGMQLGLMEAQKRALEADAAKKEADAKKTAGADTEYTRMLTELAKTEIDYKAMSTEEVAAKIKMWGDKSQLLMAEARKAASEADYNEKTMDDRVAKAGYETVNSVLDNIQKMRNIELTEAQISDCLPFLNYFFAESLYFCQEQGFLYYVLNSNLLSF